MVAVKLASLKSDLTREEQGDWVDIPDLPGVRLKVRSIESTAYRLARDVAIQRFARKYGRRPVPPEIQSREFGKIFADHILLGWDGFDEPYSPDLARERLVDPEWRRLMAHVEWAAAQLAEAELDFIETSSKNSEPPSATT